MADERACVLVSRETGESADPEPQWFEGEAIFRSPSRPDPSEWQRAQDDAVGRAVERFSLTFACQGRCPEKDRICLLDVEVVQSRSGQITARQEGGRRIPLVTWEILAKPKCGCARIFPPPPLPGRPPLGVEIAPMPGGGASSGAGMPPDMQRMIDGTAEDLQRLLRSTLGGFLLLLEARIATLLRAGGGTAGNVASPNDAA
jgi:hypothetical protein